MQLLGRQHLPDGCAPSSAARPALEVALDAARRQAAQPDNRLLRTLLRHMSAVKTQQRIQLLLDCQHRLDVDIRRCSPNNLGHSYGRAIWSLRAPCAVDFCRRKPRQVSGRIQSRAG
eukprot:4462986-Pleurochrysis_carterae.AAC.6